MANVVFTSQGLQKILDDMKKIEASGKKTTTLKFNADTQKAQLDIKKLTNQKTKTNTIKIDADTKSAQTKLASLSSSVGNFGNNIKGQAQNATGSLKGMGAAAAGAGAGFVGIQKGVDILNDYSEAGKSLSKQQALSKDLFGAIPSNIAKVSESMRMNQADTLGLINTYGLLAKGNGITGQAAEDFALRAAKATRNLALGSKKDIGEVQSAINAFLKTGRTASLEGLGLDLSSIDKLKSGMSEAEFSAKGLDLIIGQMPESWQNLSETQNSAAANQERMNAKFDDSKAKIGQVINEGLNRFSQALIDLDAKYPGFIQNLTMLVAVLGGLAIILGVVAIAAFLLQLAFSPIGLAILAIVAAIIFWGFIWATFGDQIKVIFEIVKNAVIGAMDTVKEKFNTVLNWVKENWPYILGFLTGPIGLAVAAIAKNWDKIVEGAKWALDKVKEFGNGIVDFFKSIPQKIGDAFSSLGQIVKDAFSGVIGSLPGPLQGALRGALGLFDTDFKQALESVGTITLDTSRFDFLPSQMASQTYNNQQSYTFNKGIESVHERTKLRVDMKKLRGR